ncbi:MAG: thiamine diphosphokinase [Bacteroidales bacterium]|nr:thiamine diphosphokinase [Bacteroidales bacterium]
MKLDAVILGAGEFPKKPYPRLLLEQADMIVCCDGAAASFYRYFGDRCKPDAVVGDMDSLPPRLRELYADRLVPVSEQETNDQTKALTWLLDRYPPILSSITLLAATGKREDHTIGNLSLLMEYARTRGIDGLSSPSIRIVSDYTESFAIRDSATLYVGEGRGISVFSPDNTLKIKSSGLQWPLDEVVWDNWWKATLNRASADAVTLEFSHPSVALVMLR